MFFKIQEEDNYFTISFTIITYEYISEKLDNYNYNLLPAVLLGLSYADYLRFLREKGAILIGKNSFPLAKFKTKEDLIPIINILNERMTKIYASIYN